jgi:hypothetical protein
MQWMARRLLPLAFGALLAIAPAQHARAADAWATWNASAVANDRGTPVFEVNGKPFFVYGAAFFYERISRAQWRAALERYRLLGINTIDLYLIWNWQEPDKDEIDFDGSTNPRRDLQALFSLIHRDGFKVVVRPGPVIRNEWRNGGYPAWLLEQPPYDMPLHDVLEGRYPATATFQNAHADGAAAEWMRNATHLRYASHWLHDVLTAIAPWSHDVIAIALDDDEGAYIDNQTWPAPHWRRYIEWLRAQVRSVVGPRVPLFINTYQMKVPDYSPVWAWGNWYQSDAYRIGDHDLADLAFSFGLLQTQAHAPVMSSEFQAGWLQGADQIAPRRAAPENTTLALHQMLQSGVRGVVNFPVQDTFDPAGWEAPWANWSYAWDAAYTADLLPSPRWEPTAAFGALVRDEGPLLAGAHLATDVDIAWLTSAYDPALATNARIAHLAAVTTAQQQRCRALALTCRLVDLRFESLRELERVPWLVVPRTGLPLRFTSAVERKLAALRRHIHVTSDVDDAAREGARSSTGGLRDAALLVNGRTAVLDVFNPATAARSVRARTISFDGSTHVLRACVIPPGAARDYLVRRSGIVPLSPVVPPPPVTPVPADPQSDGSPWFTLRSGRARVVVAADAGARAFVYEAAGSHANLFTTIGAGRDDVQLPPTPSPRDYIAAYTHPIEAGTFNRPYTCTQESPAALTCTYEAPDLGPSPVRFTKRYALTAGGAMTMTLQASAPAASLSALANDVDVSAAPPAVVTIEQRSGFRIVRVAYPANVPVTIRFAPAEGASPG